MSTLTELVIPTNTNIDPSFYSNEFNITPIYVQLNNTPIPSPPSTPTAQRNSEIGLFQDLHEDHSLETNHDLMYEMLYQAAENVPGWSKIPFEVLIQIIEVTQLFGGFSNFLVSFELKEEYLTNPELHSSRPTTMQNIINKVLAEPQYEEIRSKFVYQAPCVLKVAVRIYGTAEFTDREVELAMAKAASDQGISEIIYASWRHGRIASFIDGASFGRIKWFDPILSGSLGYLQGSLHSNNFLQCFEGTTLTVPPLTHPRVYYTLTDWCSKSYKTKLYKSVAQRTRTIDSVFNMFTSTQNSLYVINRPACAIKTPVRCENLIIPLPVELEPVILPLLNAYQVDTAATKKAENDYPFPHRSQRTKSLQDFHCVSSGLLNVIGFEDDQDRVGVFSNESAGDSISQKSTVLHPLGSQIDLRNYTVPTPSSRALTYDRSQLIMEYLDLPRIEQEIDWLLSQCQLFPVVYAHNDYHAGNVLLLNSLTPAVPTLHSEEGGKIDLKKEEGVALSNLSTSLENHPFSYPNETLPWIKVIDWEFGALNYRAFDCANSSNESFIVYDGSHPGFTLDLPGWVSTAYLGKYDPNVLSLDPSQSTALVDVKYESFGHTAIEKMYDQDKMDKVAKIWAQTEDERIGQDMQHILLGSFATRPYVKGESGASEPTYRPRELTWVQACLTGFYHSTVQRHFATCEDPENTPIYPFQTTSPPQQGFNPDYTLPDTVEEWLADQTPKLLFECQMMQLASQLAWIFWGITFTQDETSIATEGFGYLEHALARMIAYVAKKELMIKMDLIKSPYDKTNQ